MTHQDHVRLIKNAIPKEAGIWADLGSGEGAFTLALAECSPESTIYSIDKSQGSLEIQKDEFDRMFPNVDVNFIQVDFTTGLNLPKLDGIIMANSLHYIKDKKSILKKLKEVLKPDGKFVLIEYNADQGNQWVPYPLSFETFESLAQEAGFTKPEFISSVPSRFLEEIYCSLALNK
jgi:ubiquinone/menaquinone biosynthesis C-methylase UbiE